MRATTYCAILAVVIVIGIGTYEKYPEVVTAAAQEEPATRAEKTAGEMPRAVRSGPFVTHAQQAGLTTCNNIFTILGQQLTSGARYEVLSEWNMKDPNDHAVQALVGLTYPIMGSSSPAAGFVFASPSGTKCEGVMVRVVPSAKSCPVVAASLPGGSKLTRTLGPLSVYVLKSDSGQVLLLPTEKTCTVMSLAWAGQ